MGKRALSFARCWAIAAFSTERWSMHAMMARQSRTARPMAPRMDPTQMKTVPSGRFDVCIYGAFAMGGTVGAGYVGMDVSAAEVLLRVGMSELMELSLLALRVESLDADFVAVVLAPALADVAPSVGMASVAVAVSSAVLAVALAVVASVVVAASVAGAAHTTGVRSDKEKTVDRSSERFRESCDLFILA